MAYSQLEPSPGVVERSSQFGVIVSQFGVIVLACRNWWGSGERCHMSWIISMVGSSHASDNGASRSSVRRVQRDSGSAPIQSWHAPAPSNPVRKPIASAVTTYVRRRAECGAGIRDGPLSVRGAPRHRQGAPEDPFRPLRRKHLRDPPLPRRATSVPDAPRSGRLAAVFIAARARVPTAVGTLSLARRRRRTVR